MEFVAFFSTSRRTDFLILLYYALIIMMLA